MVGKSDMTSVFVGETLEKINYKISVKCLIVVMFLLVSTEF